MSKCQDNLHIVLAMSPSGDKLRLRCRSFPGLISNAVIDWFFPWPEDALSKVANYFLAEVKLPAENRESIVEHLVYSHMHVVSEATRFATGLSPRLVEKVCSLRKSRKRWSLAGWMWPCIQ